MDFTTSKVLRCTKQKRIIVRKALDSIVGRKYFREISKKKCRSKKNCIEIIFVLFMVTDQVLIIHYLYRIY